MKRFGTSIRHIVVLFTAVFCLSAAAGGQSRPADLKPTVILISLDGFRYDYLDKYAPPTLRAMARDGVRAKWMTPSFPTKTFPNHYTIATGLYPQNHGIVGNNVYDFGTVFTMSNLDEVTDPRWWGGEPIWVTAEKQGQRAASYFFVGTGTRIEGTLPSIYRHYNGRVPNIMRVDKVLGWLDLPADKRPTMISTYFSTTDDVGHEFGPDSEETRYAVLEVDGYLARLMDGLRTRGLEDKVNVIVVADHGMAAAYPKNATLLDDHFDLNLAERILWTREIVQIFPREGKTDEIFDKIKALPHAACWKKGTIPERLHYNTGKRVAPIVCASEIGWLTSDHRWYDRWFRELEDKDKPYGAHGYDNRYPEMRATFVAHGPAFKRGYVAEPFENVNVYELMCKILGLKPAPNDGSIEKVKGMLK
ncbi:MAG: ectonucleotide pyrophosphatase/phosphodiesterase [Pyrinomonadaceae bacterium]